MFGFIVFVIIMLGFVTLMASSSMPHDICSINEVLPASTRYNSSYSVGNVQTLHKNRFEMEIPIDDNDVNGVDEQHVVEAHLENLWKQRSAWKLHCHNSITWAFFKVNDNQPINLSKNQIMKCIIFHNKTNALEILAMHTRCKKGFIAYHKYNGTTTMKKLLNLAILFCYNNCWKIQQTLLQDLHLIMSQAKRGHMYLLMQFVVFFYLHSKFKKEHVIQVVFFEDLMLFIIKGSMLMRTIKSIRLQRLVYRLCLQLLFPPSKSFVEEILLGLIEKTLTTYV